MLDDRPSISVSQFLGLVNQTLRTIPSETFAVEGEIAEFRISQGKWVNFDLKDEEVDQKISCFTTTFQLGQPLEAGMRVRVVGYPKVFERFGKFSLNVESVVPVGEGALAKAYLLLKKKLEAEGLFDLARKRELPKFPTTIGLITSREAAAYGDFLRILGNRMGGLTIVHANVHVQGQHAVEEICQAFETFNRLPLNERPQMIVLTRGGGSLEELHAFNDERVVRAVFGSLVPVIVGVGHERDESLCDFVADVRASTPSNAAECLCADKRDVLRYVTHSEDRLSDRLDGWLHTYAISIERSTMLFEKTFLGIGHRLRSGLTDLSHAFDRFRLSLVATREHIERRQQVVEKNFTDVADKHKQQVSALERVLESINPEKVLARGYAIARSAKGVITNPLALAPGDRLSLQFSQGKVDTQVIGPSNQEKLL